MIRKFTYLIFLASLCFAAPPFSARTLLTRVGSVPVGKSAVTIPRLKTGAVYSLLLDIDAGVVNGIGPGVKVQLVQPTGVILSKTLNLGDQDFYATIHALS